MKSAKRVTRDLEKLETQLKNSLVIGDFTDSDTESETSKVINKEIKKDKVISIKHNPSKLDHYLIYGSDSDSGYESDNEITKENLIKTNKAKKRQKSIYYSDSILTKKKNFKSKRKQKKEKTHNNLSNEAFTQTNIAKKTNNKRDLSFSYEAGLLLSGRLDGYINNKFDFSKRAPSQQLEQIDDRKEKGKSKDKDIDLDLDKKQLTSESKEVIYHNHPIFTASIMMNVGKALLKEQSNGR